MTTIEEMPTGGDWVVYLQRLLEQAGYSAGGRSDVYSSDLRHAVMNFQKDHGLEDDGVVRGDTWFALAGEAKQKPQVEINWKEEYPEIFQLATSADLGDYLHKVVGIDMSIFDDESVALE